MIDAAAPPDLTSRQMWRRTTSPRGRSRLSFGLAVVGTYDGRRFQRRPSGAQTFYRELRPISADFRKRRSWSTDSTARGLAREGAHPAVAMAEAAAWVHGISAGHRPVLVTYPMAFDWAFLHYWCFERGRSAARLLASELLAGNGSTRGDEPRQLLARALEYLPAGHGDVAARFDSGFYRVDLLADCRTRGVCFSISVPRSQAMRSSLERIDEDAWQGADGLEDAEVTETTYTPTGWKHEPLARAVQ